MLEFLLPFLLYLCLSRSTQKRPRFRPLASVLSTSTCSFIWYLLCYYLIFIAWPVHCQISFRNFLFNTVKQFLQCHFLPFFILPLLLWWYGKCGIYLSCFIEETMKIERNVKPWKGKYGIQLRSNLQRMGISVSRRTSPQRNAMYIHINIYIYSTNFDPMLCNTIQVANISYFIFTKWLKVRDFLRIDSYDSMTMRFFERESQMRRRNFSSLGCVVAFVETESGLILDATMMNRVYKSDTKSTCF